ncbi:Aste57867_17774 [Aphanomyces stellatus]|uniref:Aste57867_17774 protein n=1 Tax=Aphanomyces stellatus TaxID=120398 RepID=A0A485L8H4_9STRA|nr:hypothetical protein As57867_017713 [Aphanomyces stellatus]VFT94519.1 Aste57867_17774 [Aphanomyces stellatus]
MLVRAYLGPARRAYSTAATKAAAAHALPQRIYTSPYPPLAVAPQTPWQLVHETAQSKLDSPALICGLSHNQLSFGEFDRAVQQVATSLAQRGVSKGSVVLTNMLNCFEYPILYHALTALGAVLSPAPPMYSAVELGRQLVASKATFVFTHEAVESAALQAAAEHGIAPERCFSVGTSSKAQPFSVLQAVDAIDVPAVSIDPVRDLNLLPFSSGTTGAPKGVKLSFWNLAVNALQFSFMEPFVSPGMVVLPYYHIYGATLMNAVLVAGQPQVILPKFDPATFLHALEKYKIEKAHIAPPIAAVLAKHPIVDNYDLSATKYFISGAAPLGQALEDAVFNRLGIRIKQAYGMTEMSPVSNYSRDEHVKSTSSGHLIPNTELRVVCPSSSNDLAPNQVGELWYRGPQIMLGYLDNDEATQNTMTACGFLKTGDLGFVDELGNVHVVDRLKELIKYKGHQIAPAELEDVIIKHPKVMDVACIRGYDAEREEVPKACVVVKPGESLTAQELMDYVATHVAPYKKIRQVVFVDTIPKSGSGKILRRELQAAH